MRILVLLKYGEHYVADEVIDPGDYGDFISFGLVLGGILRVPIVNVAAVEEYADREIERFRTRLAEVESGRG